MTKPLQAGVDHAELRRIMKEVIAPKIAADLEFSIANLGYPVGCGLGPHPDTCLKAAEAIIDRLGDKAIHALAAPVLPDRGWRPDREAVARIFAEDVLEQAERLLVCPADHESPGMWRDLVRRAAILALPDAPAEGAE